jgi:hypothetical protein
MGNVLNKFGCSKHLEFPNGVMVNDRQEIFISDNRAHCVKVFNYDGVYLRQIGGEGENLSLLFRFNLSDFVHCGLESSASFFFNFKELHLQAFLNTVGFA